MTVGAMTEIDRSLLVSEWVTDREDQPRCPSCRGGRPPDPSFAIYGSLDPKGHGINCAHDAALAGRGYPDQASRDRARAMLTQASEPTLVPPPPEKT